MFKDLKQEALEYHLKPRPGKIATHITKPTETQKDLSLAYTPGVAEPVREIAKDPNNAYLYTNKHNLVAVITNGTAVLGLGNVGALAAVYALQQLAHLEVPQIVKQIYQNDYLQFGPDYILPKPFDPRLKEVVSAAVAEAAIASGVANQEFSVSLYEPVYND